MVTDLAPPLGGGRYRLVELLGEGGMATVFVVEDTVLQVRRAIKVLKPALRQQAEVRERFLREARILAGISHPGLITVHDAGEEADGRMFMVMELLEGGSLADELLRSGPLPAPQVLSIARALLGALSTVHARGVIHRDIKPSNVLLAAGGAPRLADFGIARTVSADTGPMTLTGVSMGTFAYMPPEQMMSARSVDERADIYALGATLCALLIGQDPFGLRDSHTRAEHLDGIPEPLMSVIDRATRANPDERFASAEEMLGALDSPAPPVPEPSVLPPSPSPLPPTESEAAPQGRSLLPWLGAAGLVVALIGGGRLAYPPAPTSPESEPVAAPAPEPLPEAEITAAPVPEPAAAPVPEPAAAPVPEPAKPVAAPTVAAEVVLKVNARPWSRLTVDGVDKGGTPWSAPVSAGKHTVLLVDGDGRSKTLTVSVPDGVSEWVVCWSHDLDAFCPR